MQSAMETLGQNVVGEAPPGIFSLFGWKDFCWGKNVVNSHVFTIIPREEYFKRITKTTGKMHKTAGQSLIKDVLKAISEGGLCGMPCKKSENFII